jgi:hypothetical protein
MPKLLPSVFDHSSIPADPEQVPENEPRKRSNKRPELTSLELKEGNKSLFSLVDKAFHTLNEAMENADYSTAVKAAQIVLDRTGFGPKSTVDVNNNTFDFSEMSADELASRAEKLAFELRSTRKPPIEATFVDHEMVHDSRPS